MGEDLLSGDRGSRTARVAARAKKPVRSHANSVNTNQAIRGRAARQLWELMIFMVVVIVVVTVFHNVLLK